jgi:hypothetical protein
MIPIASTDLFHSIEAKLHTIAGLHTKYGPLALEEPVRPLVAIVPTDEDHTRTSKTGASQQINITLRILADNAWDLEVWRILVHQKMHDDKTWGGLAQDTRPLRDHWLFHEPVFPQTGVDLFYVLSY